MTAKVVISFDFELGWGVLDSDLWRKREKIGLYKRLRPVMQDLVSLLNNERIPTTWALVSSMLEEDPSNISLEHLPESYRLFAKDFLRDSDFHTRCAVDLVDKLSNILSFTEVASHTATHIYSGHPDVNEEHYLKDVDISLASLESYFGKNIKSLIFPRDQSDYRIPIAMKQPLNFRLNPNFFSKNDKLHRMTAGVSRLYKNVPESSIYRGGHGECYQSGSLFFSWPEGRHGGLKKILLDLQCKRLIKRLPASPSIYHVWLHPFNLAMSEEHYAYFKSFLGYLLEAREKGAVEICTMSSVCDE